MVGSHRMTNDTEDGRGSEPAGSPETDTTDLARRAALETMARYAAYTAPTLLVLLRGGEVSAGKDSLPTDVPCSVGNPDKPEQCNGWGLPTASPRSAPNLSVCRLLVVGFVAGSVILIWFLFARPQVGMVAGAAMQNPTIVAAFGVEPRLVYMATFAYGSALAGLAGAVMAPLTGMVPSLGLAFIARIFITWSSGPLILLGTTMAPGVPAMVESTAAYLSTPIYGQVAMLVVALVVLRLLPEDLSGLWRRRE